MRLVEQTKRCGGPCHTVKPWRDYYAAARWEDGTMRRPYSWCKACHNRRRRNYYRAHPDVKQAANRSYRDGLKADPVRLAHHREMDRARQVRFRQRHGGKVGTRTTLAVTSTQLDPAPFIAFFSDLCAELGTTVATNLLGIPESSWQQVKSGKRATVNIDVIERWLIRGGFHLDDVYPLEEAA